MFMHHHPEKKTAAGTSHNLDDFISTRTEKGPGVVYSLAQFVYNFYKLPMQMQSSQT